MQNQTTTFSPLRLDAGNNTNWNIDAQPVAILNETSTPHERVAYCWGIANSLLNLSELIDEHKSSEVRCVSALFSSQLKPLVEMLEYLGSNTRSDERADRGKD